ncbi:hypothetical protein [Enterococcus gilvus]|uniref:hypothetical protein n=1 Tax=Enterococcus gilvus TaxID=160453 RepID=UPI00345EF32C
MNELEEMNGMVDDLIREASTFRKNMNDGQSEIERIIHGLEIVVKQIEIISCEDKDFHRSVSLLEVLIRSLKQTYDNDEDIIWTFDKFVRNAQKNKPTSVAAGVSK